MKKLACLTAGTVAFLLVLSPTWASDIANRGTEETAQAVESQDQVVNEVAQSEATTEEETLVMTEEEATEEEEEETSLIDPFFASVSMTNSFTLGTVFRDDFTTTDYDLLSFGFSVGYRTPVETLSVRTSIGYSKFLTDSGGSTYQNEGRVGDLSLGASYGSFYQEPVTGINFGASLSLRLPTSETSRFTNLRTSIRPGLSISKSFGNLSISYSFGFSKNFHRDTSVVADLEDYNLDVIARDGGTENVGEAQIALDTGVLAEWSVSNTISLSYSWFTGFSTSIALGFSDYFTYDNGTITRDDEFTNPNAVPGRGHGQSISGSISVSYAFLDYFSADLTMDTSQPPLTEDNQNVRFPFFDFETGNLSNTTLSLTLSASY